MNSSTTTLLDQAAVGDPEALSSALKLAREDTEFARAAWDRLSKVDSSAWKVKDIVGGTDPANPSGGRSASALSHFAALFTRDLVLSFQFDLFCAVARADVGFARAAFMSSLEEKAGPKGKKPNAIAPQILRDLVEGTIAKKLGAAMEAEFASWFEELGAGTISGPFREIASHQGALTETLLARMGPGSFFGKSAKNCALLNRPNLLRKLLPALLVWEPFDNFLYQPDEVSDFESTATKQEIELKRQLLAAVEETLKDTALAEKCFRVLCGTMKEKFSTLSSPSYLFPILVTADNRRAEETLNLLFAELKKWREDGTGRYGHRQVLGWEALGRDPATGIATICELVGRGAVDASLRTRINEIARECALMALKEEDPGTGTALSQIASYGSST